MSVKLILIGPPGAGKSTVGKVIAKEMQLRLIDTDSRIEEETGKKISDIFLEDGEDSFRTIEKRVVLNALEENGVVISLGGGSILDEQVYQRLLNEPLVVYLEVSISNAAPRVGFNTERPLLVANPRAQWLKLFESRKDKYERLARFQVSTDNRKPKEVAGEIIGLIK